MQDRWRKLNEAYGMNCNFLSAACALTNNQFTLPCAAVLTGLLSRAYNACGVLLQKWRPKRDANKDLFAKNSGGEG